MEANGADRADLRNRFPEIHPPPFHNITGNGRDAKLTKQIFLSEPRTSIVNVMRATVVSPSFSDRHRWTLSPYRVNKFLFRICIGNMHVRSNSLKQDYEGNCLRAKIIIFPDNFIESGWFYVLELYFYSSGHNFRFWCFFLFYFFLFYLRPMLDSSYVNLAQGMWINDLKKLIQLLINDKFNFFHFFPKLSIFKLRFLESNNLNCWFWLDHAEILYFKRNAIESWNRSLLLLFHLNCLTRNDWMK